MRRVPMYFQLTDHFVTSASPQQAWQFFSQAQNLPRITPPWLNFTILTPEPVEIRQDSTLDYTIRWMGLPVKWRTRIIDWSPPRQFVDLQIRGPYVLWHHQHVFEPAPDGGTECWDRVIYKLPGAGVGRLTHAMVVRKQLLGIFRFRRLAIARELAPIRAMQPDVEITRI